MINADVQTHNDNLIFVRFSDPNEDFGNKPYVPVTSIAEVKRRVYVRNRAYILETMTKWLNQRLHALPDSERQINMYLHWIGSIKNTSLKHICDFIDLRRVNFESISPGKDSKFYCHYQKTIVPILDFCKIEQDHD